MPGTANLVPRLTTWICAILYTWSQLESCAGAKNVTPPHPYPHTSFLYPILSPQLIPITTLFSHPHPSMPVPIPTLNNNSEFI